MTDQPSQTSKNTPFYRYHIEAGAKMVPFAGYIMPVQYAGITEEHLAVRKNVGLFDISHMGEFEISGPDALKFIQYMTVNNAALLKPGNIQYSCMCYENGGIVDDILVYRLDNKFMLVVNASNIDKDFQWLESHLEGDVNLDNCSDDFGLLAVQGPRALNVLNGICDYDFDSFAYYNSAKVTIAGHNVLLSRTGYTGEDGFEIYVPINFADDIWKTITDEGKKHDMKLIGLGARDTLRLEMKMALYGNDIDKMASPIEAGLAWIVNFDKGDFIGRDILKAQKENKPKRRLICLELEGRAFPRHGYEIINDGQVVGNVTSGTFSPSLEKPIAMGYLPLALTKLGNKVGVRIRNKLFPATVVKPPFYKEASHL
jgi:aminomethyltransferase